MNRSQKERIQYIFLRFLDGDASPEERMELSALLKTNTDNDEWTELLEEIYSTTSPDEPFDEEQWQPVLAELIRRSRQLEGAAKPQDKRAVLTLRKIAVAASVLLVIALGSYFLFFNNKGNKQGEIVKTEPAKDVKAPETNRATITLANGETVYLDSSGNGELAMQGNIKVVKLANGQISYQTGSGEIVKELQYNTLSNPRGSKVIDMRLSDGSHVWLNAGSSVTYPVAFLGNDRSVMITGEAYFEVAPDKMKPFRVGKGDIIVEVLGTHFNVNAYDDEDNIKVTLLEGSVKVNSSQRSLIILPNQQAVATSNSILLNTDIDVDQVMAWKNGRFEFSGNDVESVMRQISRWYDVEIVYDGMRPIANFRGGIGRTENVSQVLKMLELTETVKFKVEDKKVIVTRWKQ